MVINNISEIWFGIHTPSTIWYDFNKIKYTCLKAEKYGYHLFTYTDHFMNAQDTMSPGFHQIECWTTLAGLAALTNKIKLGPLVSCYLYREPSVAAKMATTVDIMSNGRLIFGIGAGWHEEEAIQYFGRFPNIQDRMAGLEEAVTICKGMFNQERFTFKGNIYKVDNILNSPPPFNKSIPIMIGGSGEKKTLKIVAKSADISHLNVRDLKTIDKKILILKKHCKNVGRNINEIRIGTGFDPILGKDMVEANNKLKKAAKMLNTSYISLKNRAGPTFGTPEMVTDNLKQFINKGLGLITTAFYFQEDFDTYSKEILPILKEL